MTARNQWREEIPVVAGTPSAPVYFPARARALAAKVKPGGGGTARIEFTLDDPASVVAAPNAADWEVWEPGDVAVSTSRALLGAVTAVRGVATTQNAVLQVIAATDY